MGAKILRIEGLVVLIVCAALLAGCSIGQNAAAAAAPTKTADQVQATLPPVKSPGSVIAEGKAVPARDASLSFPTSGVVDKILVSEGDVVEAGQVLMRLQGNEKLSAAVSAAELAQLTAQQALDTLKRNADVARANATLSLTMAQKDLKTAQNRVYSKDYVRGSQAQIDTARANYVVAEDAVKKATELYDRLDDRPEDDPVRAEGLTQLAAARQNSDRALANLNYLLQKPSDLDVAEVQAKLEVAKANVAEAQRELSFVQDGPDINKVMLLEAQVKNAQVNLDAVKASLDDLDLKAPFAATIASVDITEGEAAVQGAPVLRIADFSNWNVETTDLTELNIARITVGEPATVRFDALPGVETTARVSSIKAFGENRQGDVVYTVILRLEAPDKQLRWNMTASVAFQEKDASQ